VRAPPGSDLGESAGVEDTMARWLRQTVRYTCALLRWVLQGRQIGAAIFLPFPGEVRSTSTSRKRRRSYRQYSSGFL
jgi:hypothetical protein